MWRAILSLLSSIAALLSGWQKDRQEQRIREDGKNEEKLKGISVINKRKSHARDIINGVLNDEKSNNDK